MRNRLVILMILMFVFSLNAQENEFIPIKNPLSEKKILQILPLIRVI